MQGTLIIDVAFSQSRVVVGELATRTDESLLIDRNAFGVVDL